MEVDGREDYYQSSESENEEAAAIAKQTQEAKRIAEKDYAAEFDEELIESSPARDQAFGPDEELIEQLTDTIAELKSLQSISDSLLTEDGARYIKVKKEAVDLYMAQLVLRLMMETKGKNVGSHPLGESIGKMNSFLQSFRRFDEALNQQASTRIEAEEEQEPKLQKKAKVAHVSFQEALDKSESESDSSIEPEKVHPNIHRRSEPTDKKPDDQQRDSIRRAKSEILKPKGLVRKRKPTERNPRVKNKLKYEKAEKKRRATYGYKEKEFTSYYEGERTGIRKDIVRSTKLT